MRKIFLVALVMGLSHMSAVGAAGGGRFGDTHRPNEVNALPGGGFEVVAELGDGARQFWCAAGEYARHQLGKSGRDRVYIMAGYGKSITSPGRKGVSFTTQPDAALRKLGEGRAQGYSLSIREVGTNRKVNLASSVCVAELEQY
jgi:hypothetical protein